MSFLGVGGDTGALRHLHGVSVSKAEARIAHGSREGGYNVDERRKAAGMTEEEFLEEVRAICRDERAERVMLFGSRARAAHRPHSDFDLAIWGLRSTRAIEERIERIPTLFSADVVNMETCRNAPLLKEVEKHGVLI